MINFHLVGVSVHVRFGIEYGQTGQQHDTCLHCHDIYYMICMEHLTVLNVYLDVFLAGRLCAK